MSRQKNHIDMLEQIEVEYFFCACTALSYYFPKEFFRQEEIYGWHLVFTPCINQKSINLIIRFFNQNKINSSFPYAVYHLRIRNLVSFAKVDATSDCFWFCFVLLFFGSLLQLQLCQTLT